MDKYATESPIGAPEEYQGQERQKLAGTVTPGAYSNQIDRTQNSDLGCGTEKGGWGKLVTLIV